PAGANHRAAKVRISIRVVRIGLNGPLERPNRLGTLTVPIEQDAKIVERARVKGIDCQSLFVMCPGLIRTPEPIDDCAEVVLGGRVAPPRGAPQNCLRLLEPAQVREA